MSFFTARKKAVTESMEALKPQMSAAKTLVDSMRESIMHAKVAVSNHGVGESIAALKVPKGFAGSWIKHNTGWYSLPVMLPPSPIEGVSSETSYFVAMGEKGALLETHQHPQTQRVFLLEGEVKEIVSGSILKQNGYMLLPPNRMHGFEALKTSVLMIVFVPPMTVNELPDVAA